MSSALERLKQAAKKAKDGGEKSYGDGNTYYYPTRDASGNGSAVIRFLPALSEDDLPWAKVYSHGFKGPTGKWYIEECPTTIDGDCPACAANSEIVSKYGQWTAVPEEVKKTVRERKRRLNYIANILVVSDPKNPENEGKVMLFKFGAKIFDKIMSALDPEFEDEDAVNVFDPMEGANFKFRIRKVEGQTNYDKSEFEVETSPIGSKAEIKAVLEQMQDLSQFTAADKFKTAEQLQQRLDGALGNTVRLATKTTSVVEEDDDVAFEPTQEPVKVSKPKPAPKPAAEDDDDDIEALMRRIADDD